MLRNVKITAVALKRKDTKSALKFIFHLSLTEIRLVVESQFIDES
jgi:hypothetical protein